MASTSFAGSAEPGFLASMSGITAVMPSAGSKSAKSGNAAPKSAKLGRRRSNVERMRPGGDGCCGAPSREKRGSTGSKLGKSSRGTRSNSAAVVGKKIHSTARRRTKKIGGVQRPKQRRGEDTVTPSRGSGRKSGSSRRRSGVSSSRRSGSTTKGTASEWRRLSSWSDKYPAVVR